MARWFVAALILFALPAYAATVETKYFSLTLPEFLTHIEGNKGSNRAEGKIYAAASEKQFLIIEYANKEARTPRQSSFEQMIEKMDGEAEADNSKNYFKGIKLERQDCSDECKAYYREAKIGDVDKGYVYAYQFFYKNENTQVFLAYAGGDQNYITSHAQMHDFIEQLKAQKL